MGRRFALLIMWLTVALTLVCSPLASYAQVEPPVYMSATGLKPPQGLDAASQQVTAFVQLADPPRSPGAPGLLRRQQIATAQANFIRGLSSAGARVVYQTQTLSNGIAVSVPASQLDRLRGLPGVVGVSIIPPKLPATAENSFGRQAPLKIAALASGATGQGVRIGLIDRGVDYTHADFGGAGTPAAYAANDPAIVEPGTFPTAKVDGYDFAGDAYDASSSGPASQPQPDGDPLECNRQSGTAANPALGQGTHDAGLVAGQGVAADGTTYPGPYGPSADYSSLRVAPGIAPEARLYALKVFGCSGTTALLRQAIDRALDPDQNGDTSDHLDVLLIALGTPFGSVDDPDALAVDDAVRAGVVVVVAAGDTVNTFYSVNSPASARLAIAVGASDGAGKIAPSSARGPLRGNDLLKPDLVAPGVAVLSAGVGTGTAATAKTGTAAAAAQVAGAAALLRQSNPTWTPSEVKAALIDAATPIAAPPSLAGAGQLGVANLPRSGLLASGQSGGLMFGAPWVAASTTATRTLQLRNTGGSDQIVTLSATDVATETGVTVTVPADPIVVPAYGVVSATVQLAIDAAGLDFTPDGATATTQQSRPRHFLAEHGGYVQVRSGSSGTRIRPGHAAHFGSVDFYLDDRLIDDSLDSREVQNYVDTTPGPHTVNVRVAGASAASPPVLSWRVDLAADRDYTLLLVGQPAALGLVVVDDTITVAPATGQALIHYVNANRVEDYWNIGPLDVYLDGVLQAAAVPVGAATGYFTIAPGPHEVDFFQTGVTPATGHRVAHKEFVAAAGEALLVGTGRHNDDDANLGDLEQRAFIGRAPAVVAGAVLASVPYTVFPYLAADAHVAAAATASSSGLTFTAVVSNTGARNAGLNGLLPTARTPLASAFELSARSPQLAGLPANQRAADVQYLGVTSNYPANRNLVTTSIYFGFSSYAPWSTPNEAEFLVYIDSNRDGIDDYVLANTNWGWANGGAPSDVPISSLYPLKSDGTLEMGIPYSYWGAFPSPVMGGGVNITPFNTSVGYQQVGLADLGLPLDPNRPNGPKGAPPASFCYHVETRARDKGFFSQVVDRVPEASSPAIAACKNRAGVLLYDVANYGIAPINTANLVFGQGAAARPVFLDVDGGQISGGANPAILQQRGGEELLVLHHQNAPFPQAEVVPVVVTTP